MPDPCAHPNCTDPAMPRRAICKRHYSLRQMHQRRVRKAKARAEAEAAAAAVKDRLTTEDAKAQAAIEADRLRERTLDDEQELALRRLRQLGQMGTAERALYERMRRVGMDQSDRRP